PRRVFWTCSCCKCRLHGPWKLRNRHRRRIILWLYYALGRLARWHYGHASPISFRKTGNRNRAFAARYDTTPPEGASLCYSLLACIGGGCRNDGPCRVSRNCHSTILTLRGSPDLRNFSLGLGCTVDTWYYTGAGSKARIRVSVLRFNHWIRIPVRNLPNITEYGRYSERLNHTNSEHDSRTPPCSRSHRGDGHASRRLPPLCTNER